MIRDIQVSFQDLVYRSGYSQKLVKEANLSVHFIQDLFLRLLETKEGIGGKIMKVNVSFTKDEKQIKFRCSDQVEDVVTVFTELPFNSLDDYLLLSNNDKSEFVLKYIVDAFKELSQKTDTINMTLINSIADECRHLEYKNHYYFGKLKSSKNRKHKAGMWIEHEVNVFKLYLNVLDKEEKVLKRELVAETTSGYPKYFPLLGGIKWTDVDTVELFNRKKETLKKIVL